METSEHLSRLERMQIRFVRSSFDNPPLDQACRWFQRHIGGLWIRAVTAHRRRVFGLDRLPPLTLDKGFLCVANHRSFFDLYTVFATLTAEGMPHRVMCPVRSGFFYDNPLGLFVNGSMSFFSMYPPIFRERRRQALNLSSMDEVVRMLQKGGTFVGVHPEGTRNKEGDPYTFLPAQAGVGRIIHRARVPVIPVFVNGLSNDFVKEATGRGPNIFIVFGEPVDFGALLDAGASPRVYRKLSERALEAVAELGEEERVLRQVHDVA